MATPRPVKAPRDLRSALAPLLVVAACLLGMPLTAPAAASAVTPETYTPTPGPIFSDPTLGPETPEARRIVDALHDMITNTPPGATIRVVTLRINVPLLVDDLVAAHQRGVRVRVVLPRDMNTDANAKQVAAELNLHRTSAADTSYLVYCRKACYDDHAFSTAHAKLYMFSTTGTAHQVVMSSSANISKSGYHTAFNDAYVLVGNKLLYDASRRFFDGLRRDRTPTRNPYFSASDPRYVVKFFPDFHRLASVDAISSIFNSTSCHAGARAGDGRGHTVVSLIQPEWSANRRAIIDRLAVLRDRGCVVKLLVTREGVAPGALRKLLAKRLDVRFTDHFDGDFRTSYAHSKYVAISGGFNADASTNTVFTGSANMTLTATRSSDNQLLRIRNDAIVYGAYATNFASVWDKSTPLTRSNHRLTSGQRAASLEE